MSQIKFKIKQIKFKPIDIYDKIEKVEKIFRDLNGLFGFSTLLFIIIYYLIRSKTGNTVNWAIYPYGISVILMLFCSGTLIILGVLHIIKKYIIKRQTQNGIDYWKIVDDIKKEKENA